MSRQPLLHAAALDAAATHVAEPPGVPELALRGTMVGGYRCEDVIGNGGMGVVYRAVHPVLGTHAAVKVIRREFAPSRELAERFLSEARAIAAIRHPHIVQLYDLVSLPDGRLGLVMEYLHGQTLEQVAGQQPMPPERVRGILLQLCNALAAAHQRGIVHRDIKAQNVLLLEGTPTDEVKLLDFGLAKPEAQDAGLTIPGVVLGTPHYMSPEQILGEPVDRRSDVYSLGVLAYRMLAGRVPFEGVPAEVMFHHMRTAPARPKEISGHLWNVLAQALAKRREERFSDMLQFAQALERQTIETPTPPVRRPPFVAHVEGSVVTLRFRSEDAFLHVERHELATGRVFVPAASPPGAGPVTLVLDVPGRAATEAPAVLQTILDEPTAAQQHMPAGFVLRLRGPLRFRAPAPTMPFQPRLRPRAERFAQRLPIAFGPSPEVQYIGFTTDVSPQGLGLVSPYVIPVGTELFLQLSLPSQEKAQLQGMVVWSRVVLQGDQRNGALGLQLSSADEVYFHLLASVSKRAGNRPSLPEGWRRAGSEPVH